jgi:hypothetical protein
MIAVFRLRCSSTVLGVLTRVPRPRIFGSNRSENDTFRSFVVSMVGVNIMRLHIYVCVSMLWSSITFD